jgi:Na+-translocating ferredoxin:NAD+ oxidoreductase subunit D
MPKPEFVLESSPHLSRGDSVSRMMWTVMLTLAPASVVSVYVFGLRALVLMAVCVAGAVGTEMVADRWRNGKWSVSGDGSIAITGLLLALTLPPGFPLFEALLGAIVASAIGKHVFGGLGHNIFNPALVGRAFLQAAFPVEITTWAAPAGWKAFALDATTTATPLAQMKFEHVAPSLDSLFLGGVSGSLGETSALALIIGGIALIVTDYIDWRVPTVMIGTVAVFAGLLHAIDPAIYASPLSHIFAGGLMLGAWFMATDLVTSPVTNGGRAVFAVGCGLLVVVIRTWGGLPEGVMYSILLMNAATPLINRWMTPRLFGEART